MKRWLLFVAFLLLIIVLGVVFLSQRESKTAETTIPTAVSTTTTPEVKNLITLTRDGFSPNILTIKAGETVTWINETGIIATVNSDPHPTHTDYEPLNLGNFTKGKAHTLTFPNPGTYSYHNHFNFDQKGTITVE